MITYVDTSSLLKLVIQEEGSERVELIWGSAEALVAVSLIEVEGRAALAAARRGRGLSAAQHRRAVTELTLLLDELAIVEVTRGLISEAAQLADDEGLRGYDAVHLAGALAVGAVVLTTADAALCDAAERRGMNVLNPLDP